MKLAASSTSYPYPQNDLWRGAKSLKRSETITEEVKIHPGVIVGASLLLGVGGVLLYALRALAAPPGAQFEVSDLVISPEAVGVGQPVAISVLVINIGTEAGSETIIFEVNGEMAEQTVTLAPGESEVVTFEVTPEVAKTYGVSVDGLYGTFVATEVGVADIRLSNLTITPSEVMVGETVYISVTATNYGDAVGSRTIICEVT